MNPLIPPIFPAETILLEYGILTAERQKRHDRKGRIFISQPEIIDALLLVITPRRVKYHNIPSVRLTQMVPVLTQRNHFQLSSDPEDRAVDIYTIDMVRKYLESGFIDEALNQLEQASEPTQ